jgi:hypothetical protein
LLYDLARVWTLKTQLNSTSSTISENGTSVKKIVVDLLRYFLFEEKVTKENFRNHNPRGDSPSRLPEFRCGWLFQNHRNRRPRTEIERTIQSSTHLPMISGALRKNLDQC